MKLLKLLLLLAALPVFTACEDEDPDPDARATIIEIASGDARFSTLVAALEKAELVSALEGVGPFTVFAPTNEAFDQLLADLGASSLDDLTKEQLTPILLHHVASGAVRSTDLSNGYINTLSEGPNGTSLSLQVDLSNGVVLNGSAEVTGADVIASNGILHVIDEVMLPPSVVDLALNNENFTTLVAALTRADLSTDFVGVLSGAGPFTVFAPTNTAFQALLDSNPAWSSLDDIDAATLEAVLKYHVVAGANVPSGDITDGAELTTFEGSTVRANLDGGTVTLTDGQDGTSNVIIADVQGTNGVVHAIDQVILP